MRYIILLALFLSGCDHNTVGVEPERVVITDQCLRREIFKECLKSVPSGPLATKYNDWDEVVSECRHSAYYMSRRQRGVVKLECRGD